MSTKPSRCEGASQSHLHACMHADVEIDAARYGRLARLAVEAGLRAPPGRPTAASCGHGGGHLNVAAASAEAEPRTRQWHVVVAAISGLWVVEGAARMGSCTSTSTRTLTHTRSRAAAQPRSRTFAHAHKPPRVRLDLLEDSVAQPSARPPLPGFRPSSQPSTATPHPTEDL